MLAAQLHGKLTPEEEGMEDILTSNAFGSFKYVDDPNEALVPFLKMARAPSGRHLLDDLPPVVRVHYRFWTWLSEPGCQGAEPDVIVELSHRDGSRTAVLVESKYKSGKSSEADDTDVPTDQLAKEYDNLISWAHGEGFSRYFVLYATADIGPPWEDISRSTAELKEDRGIEADIYWVSWRVLPRLLEGVRSEILQDLAAVLRRQGLTFFEGVDGPAGNLPGARWVFRRGGRFAWQPSSQGPRYRFKGRESSYVWREPPTAVGLGHWRVAGI